MNNWTELKNLDGATVYVDVTKIEAVLPHGENQSVICLSNTKVYIDAEPATVVKSIMKRIGA